MLISEKQLKRVLWLSLGGTKGGIMRLNVLLLLQKRPSNKNQIAKALGIDYTTAMYHIRVLEKQGFVQSEKKQYGTVYFLSAMLEEHGKLLSDMKEHIG